MSNHKSYYFAVKQRKEEMFYLTTHSTHFVYGYIGVRLVITTHIDTLT